MKKILHKALWLGAGLWLLGLPAAWGVELPELMALLAKNQRAEARFVEQRWVSGLGQPLQSSGTLSFTAPDRFTRTTLEPTQETLSVQGANVVMQRGGRSRTLPLDSVPEVVAIVEAVRGTLTGNLTVLQKYFNASLQGTVGQWALVLEPIEARLSAQVSRVRITGVQRELRTVEITLADGDRSLMRIETLTSAP